MERIVNGHYADPKSTRDIIGITPAEFEVIIASLIQYHASLEMILSSTTEQRQGLFQSVVDNDLADNGQNALDIEQNLIKNEERLVVHYDRTYKILTAINQPYLGASYTDPE